MSKCGYCGTTNEDPSATFCRSCGTVLTPDPFAPEVSTEPLQPPLPGAPQLTARRAILILLLYFGAQIAAGFVIGLGFGLERAAGQTQDGLSRHGFSLTPSQTAAATLLAFIAGGVAVVVASRLLVPQDLTRTEPAGAAWVRGSNRHILEGLVFGALTGFIFTIMVGLFASVLRPHHYGPLTQMAMGTGLARAAWFALALIAAPLTEELLFRGVLYGGLRQSLGHLKAAIITTAIFCVLHVTEWIYFWPALLGIASLAVLALWVRLRSRAIGPAIAAHFGYNAILASLLILSLLFKSK